MGDGYFLLLLGLMALGFVASAIYLATTEDKISRRRRARIVVLVGLLIVVAGTIRELLLT